MTFAAGVFHARAATNAAQALAGGEVSSFSTSDVAACLAVEDLGRHLAERLPSRAASVVGPVDRVVEEAFMSTLTDLLATAGIVMVVGTVLAAWLTGPGGRGGRGSSG